MPFRRRPVSRRACFPALAVLIAGLLLTPAPAAAEDWPEWRGAGRLGVWRESGIIDRFPAGGLKAAWRAPVQAGYAGPAVADGRVFLLDWREDPESRTLDGAERVIALDERTGEPLWSHEWTTSYRMLMATYAIGPRATPTVDGERVYVVGATGRLWCLDAASGRVIWDKDYVSEYGTSVPTWGITSAPLVDGERLITVVGGEPDGLVMAFDKRTGDELWRSLEVVSEMGYAQPVIYEAGGARQLIIWLPHALASLDPATGAVYWQEPWDVYAGMTVATPIRSGDYLFVTQLYGGSLMMRLDNDRPDAAVLWNRKGRSELPGETDGLHAMITTPLILGDYVYGIDSYGELRGLSARTGERLWMSREMTVQNRWGTAFLVQQGDRFFVNNEEGDLIIAQFTPQGYVELDRTPLIEPTSTGGHRPNSWQRTVNWSHPAYANGHILQRNDRELIRFSLAAADY